MADQGTAPPTGEVLLGPPEPAPPTPLDPPEIFYNKRWRVPPLVVHTQEEADALDPAEWTQNPPPQIGPDQYPKLYFNVNVAPKLVDNAAEEKMLGDEWKEYSLSESLIRAAQAKLDAAASKPATP